VNKFTAKKFYEINSVSNRNIFGENITNNKFNISKFCLNFHKKALMAWVLLYLKGASVLKVLVLRANIRLGQKTCQEQTLQLFLPNSP
jgi:hypothetical protein